MTRNPQQPSRRDLLTGRVLLDGVRRAGERAADGVVEAAAALEQPQAPSGGDTVRLSTRAMACEFAVIMNADVGGQVGIASDGLEMLHDLERQMTVYREDSELSLLNAAAAERPVRVEPQLYELLRRACELCRTTDGGFDPTAGPLIALWRLCRDQGRIPTAAEIAACRECIGVDRVQFEDEQCTVQFDRPGVELNLGGIGKGYALDRVAEWMQGQGLTDFLFHGGHSSVLARGDHNRTGGWPVSLRDPLFPDRSFATVLLTDCALSSSGSGVQHFRHAGKRYGHILDPRSGRPVDGVLHVTVVAPTAAEADALSTAFFANGVENAQRYCDNRKGIGAVLIPPARGRTLQPVVCGTLEGALFPQWEARMKDEG